MQGASTAHSVPQENVPSCEMVSQAMFSQLKMPSGERFWVEDDLGYYTSFS